MKASSQILVSLLVASGLFCIGEAKLFVSKLNGNDIVELEKALNNNMLGPAFYVAATTKLIDNDPDKPRIPFSESGVVQAKNVDV